MILSGGILSEWIIFEGIISRGNLVLDSFILVVQFSVMLQTSMLISVHHYFSSTMGNMSCKCCWPDGYQSLPNPQPVGAQPAPLPVVVGNLNDLLYINWLKATRGLRLTVKVLHRFCDVEMKILHAQLVTRCRGNTQCSGSCSAKDVKKIQGQLTVDKCPTTVCSTWLAEIEQMRTSNKTRLTYPNADILQWPQHYWQVAKVFMGHGQDASSVKSSDTDASGILMLIQNCKHFINIINTTKAGAVSITHIVQDSRLTTEPVKTVASK